MSANFVCKFVAKFRCLFKMATFSSPFNRIALCLVIVIIRNEVQNEFRSIVINISKLPANVFFQKHAEIESKEKINFQF